MPGFHVRLSYINTILTLIGVWLDGQAWKEGGGNMEEGLCRRRNLKEICGGKYGGNSRKCLVERM